MTKILIVEDEPNMRLGLKDNLEFEGYQVDYAEEGETGLKNILEGDYNLILLDVMLPKMSGFDVCKTVRKKGNNVPIILLTAKGEEIDKVLGLELGADDYVTKPFGLRELLARIKAILRRNESSSQSQQKNSFISIGRIEVNFSSYNALENGLAVQMSHKEFEILSYLWNNRNSTVSRDDLLNNVWGYDESPTTRTVDNFILKLRQKIEKDPDHPKIILTVHGIGYKLIA
ncbi:MAG: response regulator transcription factor [Ignavibacteria bacterium]